MPLERYRIDFGPVDNLPEGWKPFAFAAAYTWSRKSAVRIARIDGHPLTTVTDRWTGKQVEL